jgi:CelD/BcsL family acetyltransferase involved in cellulose biosynthesis
MKTEIIKNWVGVDALASEWNDLLADSNANTIFLTWEWISAWRWTIQDSVRPFVIVVRNGENRLVGLGAFYFCKLSLACLLPYRCLRTMGDYPTGAEYPDWIVRRSCEEQAAEAIATELAANAADWDLMWLPLMSGWTGASERIRNACDSSGLRWQARPTDFSAIPLPRSYADYELLLSKKARDELRRSCRTVYERSQAQFELCDKPECLPEHLDAMFDLNAKRWASAGMLGTFVRKPLEARFYREFCPVALERGWLLLSALRIDGSIKAVDVGYVYNGKFLSLQGGFDPEGPKNMGHAQRKRVLEILIAKGVGEFDYLGTVTDYKLRSGARERLGYQVFIGSPSWRTFPVFKAGMWPTGRYLQFRGLPK